MLSSGEDDDDEFGDDGIDYDEVAEIADKSEVKKKGKAPAKSSGASKAKPSAGKKSGTSVRPSSCDK